MVPAADGAGGDIQQPVVAAGVPAPDPTGVGVNDKLGLVVGPGIVLDAEGLIGPFRDEGGLGDDDGLREGGGIDPDKSLLCQGGVGTAVLHPSRLGDAPGAEGPLHVDILEG